MSGQRTRTGPGVSVPSVAIVGADGAQIVPADGSTSDPVAMVRGIPGGTPFSDLMWNNGTSNGAGGGLAALNGVFSAGTPRIVYRAPAAGTVLLVERMAFQMTISSGTFDNDGGWANASGGLVGGSVRIQVVPSAPATYGTAPTWQHRPIDGGTSGITGNIGFLRIPGSFPKSIGALGYVWEIDLRAMCGGDPVALTGTEAIRVVVDADTTLGSCNGLEAMISGRILTL